MLSITVTIPPISRVSDAIRLSNEGELFTEKYQRAGGELRYFSVNSDPEFDNFITRRRKTTGSTICLIIDT